MWTETDSTKGSKSLELGDQGKGDRRPRIGYDFCAMGCHHYLGGKTFWFGSVRLVKLRCSCLSVVDFRKHVLNFL